MFLKEEIEAAKKLFLQIHDYRYNYVFKISVSSRDWENNDWIAVTKGFNSKTNKVFQLKLTDISILKVLSGKKINISTGYNKYYDIVLLGSRFGQFTRYFVVDIDSNKDNEYFNVETIDKILEITKSFGSPVFMRSSHSGGWHLRWYFSEPIRTFYLALYLRNLFLDNGFKLTPGKLEIYPNVKSRADTKYQAIRLPCQKGSALLSSEDVRVIAKWEEDPKLFLIYWAEEVASKLIESSKIASLITPTFRNPGTEKWFKEYQGLKEKGLTGFSQTNYAIGRIAQGLVTFEGIINIAELIKSLCKWIDLKHNGYSEEYNEDPRIAYEHCRRWATTAISKRTPYKQLKTMKTKKQNNTNKAKSTYYDFVINKYLREEKISLKMSQMEISRITQIPRAVIQRKIKNLKAICP